MDNIKNNEQMKVQTQSAEAVERQTGEEEQSISLGKFKDVNALLNAYNSLQAEFTKRCQRLKELEGVVTTPDKTEVRASYDEDTDTSAKGITQKEKEEILKDYLKEVLVSKQKALVMDGVGVGVRTPSQKPKTIFEAGVLAREIL